MPKIKDYHPSIDWMKFCINHYNGHKSMPDANFESGGLSSFGVMTPQNFLLKKGRSH